MLKTLKKWFSGSPVQQGDGGWRSILEPFSGAWQRNVKVETHGSIASYSTVYACCSRIAQDVGKLPFRLQRLSGDSVWSEVRSPAFSPILRRPNHFQTPQQFREAWTLSRLQFGNTYVLKQRDGRGVVTGLYILDPKKVQLLVGDYGGVFYRLLTDSLTNNGVYIPNGAVPEESGLVVPASEIIHDREPTTFFHPLIGVPPLNAALAPASKNIKIDRSSSAFFENHAAPGGLLTAPAGISDDDAATLKKYWDDNFTGSNSGKISVIGADMKFTSFAFNASDSQLVEQQKYSDYEIARAFGVPPWMLGLEQLPVGSRVDDMNTAYFTAALQARIESMEACLASGLSLPEDFRIEIDTTVLLRLDEQQQTEIAARLIQGGIATPNEARRRFNLPPIAGGDMVYLQEQNYSLEALSRRDEGPDPFGSGSTGEKEMPEALQRRVREMGEKRRLRYDWITRTWHPVG